MFGYYFKSYICQKYFCAAILLSISIYLCRITYSLYQNVLNKNSFKSRLKGPLLSNDAMLIEHIKKSDLIPPSNLTYNFQDPNDLDNQIFLRSAVHLNKVITEMFPPKSGLRNGFFIEAGAFDGEYASNTLYLERELGWTGLLIEPNKQLFSKLLKKHRKAWSCNCCLSPKPFPFQTQLTLPSILHEDGTIKIFGLRGSLTESRKYLEYFTSGDFYHYETVQCYPIESILKALGITHVDLFSVDVEGLEMEILEHFPWETVLVDTWIIEYHRVDNKTKTHIKDNLFIKRFVERGYKLYKYIKDSVPFNYIFIKNIEQRS